MKIDFVSDVACPWCAVGLNSLEQALANIGDAIPVEIEFQPFELNPDMPAEGADTIEYLSRRYGIDAAQIRANQAAIRERGAAVGFAFGERGRVWNTFDAHRLLQWAHAEAGAAAQRKLKHALLAAYHGQGRNPGARDVLLELVAASGLDATHAAQILDGDAFAAEVRAAERQWQEAGIHSVPAVVVDRRHLISGAQTPQVFEQALRRLAAAA
ncbi:MAG: DsbA family oxidoreductase [Burkholderiales bacterium]|nr:DsbA family oxidoreductase [Burkholderiales bacterium]